MRSKSKETTEQSVEVVQQSNEMTIKASVDEEREESNQSEGEAHMEQNLQPVEVIKV